MKPSVLVAAMASVLMGMCAADEPHWQESNTGSSASLRGLAVATETATTAATTTAIWATGSKGTVLVSNDLGKSWLSVGPGAYPELEFRSVHAWNDRQAIVASAGVPAIALKTDDAGKTWREVHRDLHPKAFFDGLKFIDQRRGVLFGDPVDGRFTVLTTSDAGESWHTVSRAALPETLKDEAAFAASNSAMIVAAPASIWIGTGGATAEQSRVLHSTDFGKSWQVTLCPLTSSASSGIFSLALSKDGNTLMAVGGDYRPDARSLTTGALSIDRGASYSLPKQPPSGYRSEVFFPRTNFGRPDQPALTIHPTATTGPSSATQAFMRWPFCLMVKLSPSDPMVASASASHSRSPKVARTSGARTEAHLLRRHKTI